ncbi:MAG TPA: high-potential iron-sulfur protein [Steroidobacteraceae bacterium]|nr:high-potential iron-sulfur protein [Steroidobacteraceae bacterium]
MTQAFDESRRDLLRNVALGLALLPAAAAPLRPAVAAELPLVTGDDPMAKALKYVPDVSKSADAKPGSKCSNCMLYQGTAGAAQGPCQLFPGKAVKADGWCASWNLKK